MSSNTNTIIPGEFPFAQKVKDEILSKLLEPEFPEYHTLEIGDWDFNELAQGWWELVNMKTLSIINVEDHPTTYSAEGNSKEYLDYLAQKAAHFIWKEEVK